MTPALRSRMLGRQFNQFGRTATLSLAALLATVVLSACGISTVSMDKSFDSNSADAIVVVAARLDGSDDYNREIHTNNPYGRIYSIHWRRYDPETDIATKEPSPDGFAIAVGLNSDTIQTCRVMKGETLYCIHDIDPGYYVLESSSVYHQSRSSSVYSGYLTSRTNLGVGKNFLGGIQINNDMPVSESGSQRFKVEPGFVYFVGQYSLSTHGQIDSAQFDTNLAMEFLSEFKSIEGEIRVPEFHEPYSLKLRTGFCPTLFKIQQIEFSYASPC